MPNCVQCDKFFRTAAGVRMHSRVHQAADVPQNRPASPLPADTPNAEPNSPERVHQQRPEQQVQGRHQCVHLQILVNDVRLAARQDR